MNRRFGAGGAPIGIAGSTSLFAVLNVSERADKMAENQRARSGEPVLELDPALERPAQASRCSLASGVAMLLGPEAEILIHSPFLPQPFLDNRPLAGRKASELAPRALGDLMGRLWKLSRTQATAAASEIILALQPSAPGGQTHLSIRVSPHPEDPSLSVVTIRDLTRERHRMGALLDQIESLRAQKDEWETVARSVAHDVKSSLSALNGFISLALTRSGEIPSAASENLNRALGVCARLRALTETVVGKEEPGQLVTEWTDLGQLGQRLLGALQAAHPDLRFTWCVEACQTLASVPDPVLWNVLWNLLDNSVKYRSPGEDLHIELRTWSEGEAILVEVRDNGRGLVAGELEAIFAANRRGSNSGDQEGNGLGLFSARRAIEKWGGRLWAEPTASGSSFRVTVPARTRSGERGTFVR